MLEEFRGDLHIHTCLSPCGDLSMLPTLIVMEAKEKNIDMIAICDHNTTENVVAVQKAGEKEGVSVIGGIEITSQEEAHILAYFKSSSDLRKIQEVIYEHLPGTNDASVFGEQVIVDEEDEMLGVNEKLLIGATTLFLEQIVDIIHSLGGVAIASHIDREAFSIISQLGFIPEGLELDGLEVSSLGRLENLRAKYPRVNNFPIVRFSDAHYLVDIGKQVTSFLLESASSDEIFDAFRGIGGRKILSA